MLALLAEGLAVLGTGSFMTQRLGGADRDWGSRLAHWRDGLDLARGSADDWLGKGLGRLPANLARQGSKNELSGDLRWHEKDAETGSAYVTLSGPASRAELGGRFGLTQQVRLPLAAAQAVRLKVRVLRETEVQLELCERHLLYDRDCQGAFVRLPPAQGQWQTLEIGLNGPPLPALAGPGPLFAVFSLSVTDAGGSADVAAVELFDERGKPLLENGRFSAGLAHWLGSAQYYFLPWHIDNLYLELLIERGLAGLLAVAALLAFALWNLLVRSARSDTLSPYLASALCAALALGGVSSFMDVPRVAFLFWLFAFFAAQS